MVFNIKKVSAVLGTFVMLGSTLGIAAAASYPAPFVSGGSADAAVVYGTGQGVSVLDAVQAGNIQSNLQSFLGGGSGPSTVSGGDSVSFSKSSTKWQTGYGLKEVITTAVTDDSPSGGLPTLLADGKYIDDDNDEFDFEQKVQMANISISLFEDSDYIEDEPTLGIRVANGNPILNYTLTMNDQPEWGDLATSDMVVMGKEYYVLSITNGTTLNLLDSAVASTLSEGESTTLTVDGVSYDVSINFIGSSTVKLDVNGETTNSLAKAETQKIGTGAYVGIRDINTQDYQGGIKNVEFSIGKGKLQIKHGTDIKINDDTVTDVKAYITNGASSADTTLSKIEIEWKADDDLFVAEDSSPLMPGFEALKLSFGGMVYKAEEKITLKATDDKTVTLLKFPLKDSVEDIDILFGDNKNFTGIGSELGKELGTTNGTVLVVNDSYKTFVVSWNDKSDAESYIMRATNFVDEASGNKTDFQYRKDGAWVDAGVGKKAGDTVTIGNMEITVNFVNKTAKAVNLTAGTNVEFNKLYSAEGMKVFLPFIGTGGGTNARNESGEGPGPFGNNPGWLNVTRQATFNLTFSEEDKNENIGQGENITLELSYNTASTPEAEVTGVNYYSPGTSSGSARGSGPDHNSGTNSVTGKEIQNTDVFRNFAYSALGTEVLWDRPSGSGQKSVELIYHGEEAYAEVFLTAPGAVVSGGDGSGGPLGDILVKDSEISSVSTKNLIIVGGSCINSAAANVVGGALCGGAFADATGAGSGQFVIQSFDGAYASGKIALLVAGYDASDTVNAAKYLTTQTVDTAAGKKYIGTSATSASMVAEEA